MNTKQISLLLAQPLPQGQSVQSFSHFPTTSEGMREWLNGLSLKQISQVSIELRQTLVELAQINVSEAERFAYMEMLSPAVGSLISSLKKHYLKQTVVLDERSAGIATLAQQLRAYCLAIYRTIFSRLHDSEPAPKQGGLKSLFSKSQAPDVTALSCHRAIRQIGELIFETRLLYMASFPHVWRTLGELYLKAEHLNLLNQSFETPGDELGVATSIKTEYLRSILLGVSGTNRLRQPEIQKLWRISPLWAEKLSAGRTPGSHDLFVIDLNEDKPPLYITTSAELSNQIIYIGAAELLQHLKELSSGQATDKREADLVRSNLVDYVVRSIHEPLERGFARHAYSGSLTIAVGLLSVHYHMAGKRPFGQVIQLKELMRSKQSAALLVDKAMHDASGNLKFDSNDSASIETSHFATNEVKIVNISPGGYRARWEAPVSPKLKTGELLCLRESSDEPWQIGVVRWVEQVPGVGAEFGVEVLSVDATAAGAAPARPEDIQDQYMRALILPEVKSLQRAASLVTSSYHFKPGHRIKIRVGSQEVIAKLGQSYMTSQIFNQYDFSIISKGSKGL